MVELNEQQKKAVESKASHIVCVAGAGAGKTATMIQRICRIIDDGVSPSSVLVLTFTRAAALEMKERFIQMRPNTFSPEFKTFHAFCYHLIVQDREVRTALGYSSIPAIANSSDTRRLLQEAKMQSNCKLSEKQLNDVKSLTPKQLYEYAKYKKTLQRLMHAKELMTFDQLSEDVTQLFVEDASCIQPYKKKFKYIFVDEFQDTDKIQFKFVESFTDSDIYVCGDILQSIYSFRAADSSLMKGLVDDPNWEVIKLYKNYRSGKAICKFANDSTSYASPQYRILLDPVKDTAGIVQNTTIFQESSYDVLPEDAAEDILLTLSALEGECAILVRSNKELNELKGLLRKSDIKFVTHKRNEEYLKILEAVKSNEYFLSWITTQLTSDQYAQYVRLQMLENPENPLQDFYIKFSRIDRIRYLMDTVSRIRIVLQDTSLDPSSKVLEVLRLLGTDENITVACDCSISNSKLLDEIIDELQKQTASDIYVGTIHSVKGLEFKNVLLVGVNGASFPLMNEDNLNLYYVGITRAKDFLKVYQYV